MYAVLCVFLFTEIICVYMVASFYSSQLHFLMLKTGFCMLSPPLSLTAIKNLNKPKKPCPNGTSTWATPRPNGRNAIKMVVEWFFLTNFVSGPLARIWTWTMTTINFYCTPLWYAFKRHKTAKATGNTHMKEAWKNSLARDDRYWLGCILIGEKDDAAETK